MSDNTIPSNVNNYMDRIAETNGKVQKAVSFFNYHNDRVQGDNSYGEDTRPDIKTELDHGAVLIDINDRSLNKVSKDLSWGMTFAGASTNRTKEEIRDNFEDMRGIIHMFQQLDDAKLAHLYGTNIDEKSLQNVENITNMIIQATHAAKENF